MIKVFELPEGDRANAIDQCQLKDVAKQSDQDLTLQFPVKPGKPSCQIPTDPAGSSAYKTANYNSLPAEAPAKACVASCCEPLVPG